MLFREHRGDLDESLKTTTELPDKASLVEHCQKLLSPFKFEYADLMVGQCSGGDGVKGWENIYPVEIKGYGLYGWVKRTLLTAIRRDEKPKLRLATKWRLFIFTDSQCAVSSQ